MKAVKLCNTRNIFIQLMGSLGRKFMYKKLATVGRNFQKQHLT